MKWPARTSVWAARQSAVLLLALLLIPAAWLRADEATARFTWDQANSRMAAARTPADYLEAARTYNQLARSGIRSGPLFFNLGTALLLAGDGENAVAALRRAERYQGSTPEIRVNLRQSLALQNGQPDADLPWDRVVFFWHYDEPLRVRVLIALCGWLLIWAALLIRRMLPAQAADPAPAAQRRDALASRLHSLAGSCIFFGLLLLILFAGSAAVSLFQEQMEDHAWSERVFVSKPPPEQAS